jgi:hypothetical protein
MTRRTVALGPIAAPAQRLEARRESVLDQPAIQLVALAFVGPEKLLAVLASIPVDVIDGELRYRPAARTCTDSAIMIEYRGPVPISVLLACDSRTLKHSLRISSPVPLHIRPLLVSSCRITATLMVGIICQPLAAIFLVVNATLFGMRLAIPAVSLAGLIWVRGPVPAHLLAVPGFPLFGS